MNPRCIDRITGHIWLTVCGCGVEVYERIQKDNITYQIWNIFPKNPDDKELLLLDNNDCVVHMVYKGHVIGMDFFTLTALCHWIRYVNGEYKPRHYA